MLLNNITIAKTMPIGKIAFASKRKNKENQGDTFECSSKSKEKSFTINPIKLAKIKAQEIIKNAQYQAATILNDAVSSADAYKRDVLQDTDEEMKKYYDEYYDLDGTPLYVSSGVGVSMINYRLFNKPSINFYRINKYPPV